MGFLGSQVHTFDLLLWVSLLKQDKEEKQSEERKSVQMGCADPVLDFRFLMFQYLIIGNVNALIILDVKILDVGMQVAVQF